VSIYILWPGKRDKFIHTDEPSQQVELVKPQMSGVQEKNTKQNEIAKEQIEKKPIKRIQSLKDPVIKDAPLKTLAPATSYVEAEPIPGFPKLYEYLNTKIIYPLQMVKDSIQGVESVSFVIDEKGNLGQIAILNSLGPLFDEETVRLLNQMPAWKPASLNGKPVGSRISLPLIFTVHASKKEGQ